jgi:hypothetical protein
VFRQKTVSTDRLTFLGENIILRDKIVSGTI